jgi:hypothetical protein
VSQFRHRRQHPVADTLKGMQEWHTHRQACHSALTRVAESLNKARSVPSPKGSPILRAAADAFNAHATQDYLQGMLYPSPELPRQLSEAILQLTSQTHMARVACHDVMAKCSIFLPRLGVLECSCQHDLLRAFSEPFQEVFERSDCNSPSTSGAEISSCKACRSIVEGRTDSSNVVDVVGPQRNFNRSKPASTSHPCLVGDVTDLVQRPMWQETLNFQETLSSSLEAALLLGFCVEGIQQESALLEAVLQGVDMNTSRDALDAYMEIGGIQPFVCEDVFSCLEPACLLLVELLR